LESELFGHKKGSFTGAIADKTGLFEQANFGTIFLDEIGDMPIDMQAKLLRAIQEGEIRRIGTNVNIKVDVRVVAATNKNLVALIAEKKFREDLYYRLNVLPVRLPPLRERREDVTLLIDHFLEKYARGGAIKIIEQAALRYLVNYSWPGNVRELENEIERAVVLSGDVIKETDLSESVRGAMAAGNTLQHRITGSTYEVEHGKGRITGSTYEVEHGKGIRETRMEVERQLIIDALNRSGGNKTEAAKALGLSRFGLYKKMDRYKVK
jgi:transcriptional regulator with GAF, ATPase, and Fis domain